VVLVAAATYLWVLVCLALWVLGPMVGFRWQPVMIDAGSMTPAINPGDVVLVDTDADVHDLGPGTVITFEDPGWDDLLVTHRIVQQLDDGAYRTRGDGSAVADSTSIQPDAILGSGRLLVPFIGLPMLWVDQDPTAAGVWVLMTLTAWVVVARVKELARPLTGVDADATSGGTSARRRRPRGRIARAARRVSGGPAPIAGPVRRWGPTTLSAVTAGLLVTELGPVVIAWPLFILFVDPCGPHLPIGRWHRRWREGRVTRRLAPAPLGGTALSVVMVVVTLASTATFVAASANPTNSFAADVLSGPTGLTAIGGSDVQLSWTGSPDASVAGYRVFRSASSGGPYTQIAEVTPRTTTSHVDAPADGTYHYVVRAFVAGWESPQSNEDSATVSTVLPMPTPDSTSQATPGTGSGQDWMHTVGSGSDRILVVTTVSNSQPALSVEFGGVPLTLIGRERDSDNATQVSMWYLLAPPAGIGKIGVVYSGSGQVKLAGATSWNGVNQSTPVGAWTSARGTSATASVAISSAPGERIIDVVSGESVGVVTAGPDQNSLWANTQGDTSGGHSVEDGADSVTMSWDLATSHYWGIGAVALRPAGGAFATARAMPPSGSNGLLDASTLVPIGHGHMLQADAARAFLAMGYAIEADLGIDLSDRVSDSYRTYEAQVDVAARKGLYSQGGLAATPGTSQHGYGLAVDLDTSGGVGEWLTDHAEQFGFRTIPREPWHWEFGL